MNKLLIDINILKLIWIVNINNINTRFVVNYEILILL